MWLICAKPFSTIYALFMKKIVLLCCGIFFALMLQAQEFKTYPKIHIPTDSAHILRLQEINRDIWQPFIEAYATNNAEQYLRLNAPDLIRTVGSRWISIEKFAPYAEKVRSDFAAPGRKVGIGFRFFERVADENSASERGIYRFSRFNEKGERRDYYARFHVFHKKINGKWQIMVDYDSNEDETIGAGDYAAALPMDEFEPWKQDYNKYPEYKGELGLIPQPDKHFIFRLWSPAATAARLCLYARGDGGTALKLISLTAGEAGTWETRLLPENKGQYYTVQVKIGGRWLDETPDPYAQAVGLNGKRAQILDLADTNPAGWNKDKSPALRQSTDIVLYELHVRDLSSNANSGIKNKGKFLGLTEKSTKNAEGLSTGLDHLRELGVTHIHLLPAFDYRSIDESLPFSPERYNWGYDPENYNVPEGSYATDATDGAVRIREFKQMVQALHAAGLRVVMDVVYNHTGATEQSVFNRVAPGYYYRQNAEGGWSDASACGNETASERAMMRRYMVESLKYWVKEYHIDGFRFDLMGIHDIETMNEISRELHALDPGIYLYGEGWTAGGSPVPDEQRALKRNTLQLDRVAAFSDDFRDALKGSVFDHDDTGFVSGKAGTEESIKFGIVAATMHPQLDYSKVNYSKAPWAPAPQQCVNYAECHDNHTLWDRLANSRPEATEAERIRMHHLALSMILTAQGVPFLHAGSEFLRTKQGVENSYQSPDAINTMDWSRKTRYADTHRFVQQLLRLRRAHPAFRMATTAAIQQHLRFLNTPMPNVVAFHLNGAAVGDTWKEIIVVHNGNAGAQTIALPEGAWSVALADGRFAAGKARQVSGKVAVEGVSTMVVWR